MIMQTVPAHDFTSPSNFVSSLETDDRGPLKRATPGNSVDENTSVSNHRFTHAASILIDSVCFLTNPPLSLSTALSEKHPTMSQEHFLPLHPPNQAARILAATRF